MVLKQRPWVICHNDATMKHVVTWDWRDDPQTAEGNGKFVRSLKMGDVVSVWGKARFPRTVNKVRKVKIDIYWAV